jgi:hypothetical protein
MPPGACRSFLFVKSRLETSRGPTPLRRKPRVAFRPFAVTAVVGHSLTAAKPGGGLG